MGKAAVAIALTAAERAELKGLAGRRRTAQGLARRAQIVLAAADGTENKAIAQARHLGRAPRSADRVTTYEGKKRPKSGIPCDRRRALYSEGLSKQEGVRTMKSQSLLAVIFSLASLVVVGPRADAAGGGTTRSIGPAIVVDSVGNLVGQFFPEFVLRKINGLWFELAVSKAGFTTVAGPCLQVAYQGTACAGTPYIYHIPADGLPMAIEVDAEGFTCSGLAANINGILYYPDPASITEITTLGSVQDINADGTLGPCMVVTPLPTFAATILTFNLSTLGLVPPFAIKESRMK